MNAEPRVLSVAQVSFFSDPQGRSPEELLWAWPTLAQVAEAAAASGVRVTVLQASQHWTRLRRNDVDYHFLPFGGVASTAAGIDAFRELAATLRPDVFHVQGLGFARDVVALAAVAPGVPIVVQDHADRPPRRFWRWPEVRRGLDAARGVLFCAREQARPFRRRGLLPARTRVHEVPESTCDFTALDQARARALSGVHGDPALLWVGHLDRNKDPLTVLDGVSLAARQLPGLKLWCCFGQAPLIREVRARIDGDPLLAGRVHLLGRVPHAQVRTLMSAADFLVQGSHREGSGYAVIEALACGLPPVVTDIPSFRTLTAHGTAGRLWPRRDARALAQALVHLAMLPRAALRAAARAQFERDLSPAALGRALHAVYLDALRP